MSIEEVTFYRAVCDGCGVQHEWLDGITAWSDERAALEMALGSEWEMIDGDLLCPDCVWGKDDEGDDDGGEA